ncbi:MAG TPA: hypothetical protein VM733_22005 [Thermoanaerobaculia bacterium]|nr:hypothetical protein [Thermoanaerobaculia bacterium]
MLHASVVVADVVTVPQAATRSVTRNATWIVPFFVIFMIVIAVRARRRRRP